MRWKVNLIELENVFRETFGKDDLTLCREMTPKDVEGWDSFGHINLLVAIEENCSIKFTSKEIANMATVGDIIESMSHHGIVVEQS